MFKGMIRCGHCGRSWSGTTYSDRMNKKTGTKGRYRFYRCQNKNPRKFGADVEKCPAKSLRTEVIEEYIWNLIIRCIVDKDEIVSQLKEVSTLQDHRLADIEFTSIHVHNMKKIVEKRKPRVWLE